jgi:hypothetical protein
MAPETEISTQTKELEDARDLRQKQPKSLYMKQTRSLIRDVCCGDDWRSG